MNEWWKIWVRVANEFDEKSINAVMLIFNTIVIYTRR